MHRGYAAIQQVRALRRQLAGVVSIARSLPAQLLDAVKELDEKVAALEGTEEDTTFLSSEEGRSLVRLNIGLRTLLEAVDSADVAPTSPQSRMLDDLNRALAQDLSKWQEMKTKDVPALNILIRRSGLQPINPELSGAINPEGRNAIEP